MEVVMSKADFGKTIMPYLIMALLVVGGGATAWGIFGALGNDKNSAPRQDASARSGQVLERTARGERGEAFESEHERGERGESEEHERGEKDDD
jgi:hypothetical protein